MDLNERKGWTEIVTAVDLDCHMAEIGQAETNANLILDMLEEYPLNNKAKILVPGCGTGQIFDYINTKKISQYVFTFTDLNSAYLERLKERLSNFPHLKYYTLTDDIESTKLTSHYDGHLVVLLLQHIDWKQGLESMLNLEPYKLYFIIQEQKNDKHPVTKERKLPPTIEKFAKIANPHLVPKSELSAYLEERGYKSLKKYEKTVPDEKTMVGLIFEKTIKHAKR